MNEENRLQEEAISAPEEPTLTPETPPLEKEPEAGFGEGLAQAEEGDRGESETEEGLFAEPASPTPMETRIECAVDGETHSLTPEEAARWARKGMEAAKEGARKSPDEAVLEVFAANSGMSREQLVQRLAQEQAKLLTEQEVSRLTQRYPEMPPELARQMGEERAKLRLADLQGVLREQAAKKQKEALKPWVQLVERFPEVQVIGDLPEEVLLAIDDGQSPVEALLNHRLREADRAQSELRNRLETEQRNQRSRAKSMGSAVGRGAGAPADPFLLGMLE